MSEQASNKRQLDNGGEEPAAKKQKVSSTLEAFVDVFETLSTDALAEIEALKHLSPSLQSEVCAYYKTCLSHTLLGGKMTRGVTVVKACELMQTLSSEQKFQACVLGWCIEWLQGFFLIADDVMDHSITRRSQPCWYRMPNVTASNAINDALLVEACIYNLLKKHLGKHPAYAEFVALFHDVAFKTEVGQHLDTNSKLFGQELDLGRFTMERYTGIVRFKTAYYSFYLSCALALHFCGQATEANLSICESVCLKMGEYFQAQDDYLDCYGDPEVIGKVGTDIQDAKCSWLVCKALETANESQRKVLVDHYGKDTPEDIQAVKDLFQQMQVAAAFEKYEEESKQQLDAEIAATESESLRAVFEFLLAKIYKRNK